MYDVAWSIGPSSQCPPRRRGMQLRELQRREHGVIIIGGGVAGFAAAAALQANGVHSWLLLEATCRTGGRIQAVDFGNPAVGRLRVELGASWLAGVAKGAPNPNPSPNHNSNPNRGRTNPLADLVTASGLKTVRVAGSSSNLSNWASFDARGRRTDGARARARVRTIVACVERASMQSKRDRSIAEATRACGWDAPREESVSRAMLWLTFAGDSGQRCGKWGRGEGRGEGWGEGRGEGSGTAPWLLCDSSAGGGTAVWLRADCDVIAM